MAKLEGYNLVAVIENGNDFSGRKDYHYALYDETIKAGDTVIVTGASSGEILTVKKVISAEAAKNIMSKNITAEVIGCVETHDYRMRVENRKRAEQIKKNLSTKKKEIEARKDDDYYADIDAEYAVMLKELRSLNV